MPVVDKITHYELSLSDDVKKKLSDVMSNFDYNLLNIDPQLSIPELVVHITRQTATEAFLSCQVAKIRNELDVLKEEYNNIYNDISYNARKTLIETYKSKFSEKMLENFLYKKHNAIIREFNDNIVNSELRYRYMCSIRDAFANKGKLLQTLRTLVVNQTDVKI